MNSTLKKQISLCALGTIFEWYDFSLFACLTPLLSQLFFQHSSHFAGIMGTFAIFASGYIMRPIGAIFFGKLGDQAGRKYSLLITIFTMTAATTAIGLIPTGSAFSTLFLVLCRLTQGFSCSGEYPGILTLLSEQPSLKRKSFIASIGIFSTGIGGVLGALLYILLSSSLGSDLMLQWGWRIPFLLGAPLGLIGYLLRKHIFESTEFVQLKQQNLTTKTPFKELLRSHARSLFIVCCISILANAVIYIDYIYFGNYALSMHKITHTQVIQLTMMVPLIYSLTILFFGFLSDIFNKKKMLLTGCCLLTLFAYPLVNIIVNGGVIEQFIGQALIVILLGVILGPFASILPEQFPARIRYSGLSITLNFSASFFGGTAPMVCTWLTQTSGMPIAPAFYIMFLGVFASFAMYLMLKNPVGESSIQTDTATPGNLSY